MLSSVPGPGSPAHVSLAAGVGTLALADHDTADLTNLQRQILHSVESIGRLKVESGRDTLHLNPIAVETIAQRLKARRCQTDCGGRRGADCSDTCHPPW